MGLSQPGSCPTHTPFSTSASTVQPTEQCVHMFWRMMPLAGAGPAPAASALRTPPNGSTPSAANPPAARPERRRNVRRSRPPLV